MLVGEREKSENMVVYTLAYWVCQKHTGVFTPSWWWWIISPRWHTSSLVGKLVTLPM